MNKQELHEAFSNIHASDALKKQVLSAEMENKKSVNGWVLVRRAVACAAVLALLLTVFLLDNSEPYFSIHVYANETDSVKLDRQGATFFIPAYDASSQPSKENDPSYRPILDSSLFDNGSLWDEQRCCIRLQLNDETKRVDQLIILVDGQEIQQDIMGEVLVLNYSKGEEKGRMIYVLVEKATRVDVVLYDDNGEKLQHYGMAITPEKGGWSVTLDNAYVTSRGSQVFSSWF